MAKVYDGMADTSVHMLAVAESIEHLSTGEFYFAMDANKKELNYYTHVRHTRLMAEGVFG